MNLGKNTLFDITLTSIKAVVIRTYPRPSRWFVVRYENGDIAQVEENQVTTMFEEYKKGLF